MGGYPDQARSRTHLRRVQCPFARFPTRAPSTGSYHLMVLPYDPARVEETGRHFDQTVRRIEAQEFEVVTAPEAAICKECDLRHLCISEGLLR